MKYNSEQSFLDKVELCLKENGCKVWREVVPDNCEHWDKPYRVDLVLFREDIGFIGVEGKNTNTLRSGGIMYKAIEQIISKYRNQTYFHGNIINRWAVTMPYKTIWDEHPNGREIKNEIFFFIKNFLQAGYNIDFLQFMEETKWRKSSIQFGSYSKNVIIIGGDSKYEH